MSQHKQAIHYTRHVSCIYHTQLLQLGTLYPVDVPMITIMYTSVNFIELFIFKLTLI